MPLLQIEKPENFSPGQEADDVFEQEFMLEQLPCSEEEQGILAEASRLPNESTKVPSPRLLIILRPRRDGKEIDPCQDSGHFGNCGPAVSASAAKHCVATGNIQNVVHVRN